MCWIMLDFVRLCMKFMEFAGFLLGSARNYAGSPFGGGVGGVDNQHGGESTMGIVWGRSVMAATPTITTDGSPSIGYGQDIGLAMTLAYPWQEPVNPVQEPVTPVQETLTPVQEPMKPLLEPAKSMQWPVSQNS